MSIYKNFASKTLRVKVHRKFLYEKKNVLEVNSNVYVSEPG
jgi:hypothetical protein